MGQLALQQRTGSDPSDHPNEQSARFDFDALKIPGKLPQVRASNEVASDRVLSRMIEKARQYNSGEALLLCRDRQVVAYFGGRTDPLTFETNWNDVCFVAERNSVSIHRDEAVVAVLDLRSVEHLLPSAILGSTFTESNPGLKPQAILVVLKR